MGDRLEDITTLTPADAVVASTSLHHVGDLGRVLDRVREVLVPGGTVVVIEWAWERFDERTALDERFERVSRAHGPCFFPDLDGTDEDDEAAAIEAGMVEATCVRYVARRRRACGAPQPA